MLQMKKILSNHHGVKSPMNLVEPVLDSWVGVPNLFCLSTTENRKWCSQKGRATDTYRDVDHMLYLIIQYVMQLQLFKYITVCFKLTHSFQFFKFIKYQASVAHQGERLRPPGLKFRFWKRLSYKIFHVSRQVFAKFLSFRNKFKIQPLP